MNGSTPPEVMNKIGINLGRGLASLIQWFDTDYGHEDLSALRAKPDKVELIRVLPFVVLHLGCLGVLFTGWSWFAVGTAAILYLVRMFAITVFYHHYFSHKTFHTSRAA